MAAGSFCRRVRISGTPAGSRWTRCRSCRAGSNRRSAGRRRECYVSNTSRGSQVYRYAVNGSPHGRGARRHPAGYGFASRAVEWRVRCVVAALLLGASSACDSPTDTGGSMRIVSRPLVPDSTFRGELARAGDTIAITVRARNAAAWRLVLQAGRSPATLVAELVDLTANHVLAQVSSHGDMPHPAVGTSWYRPNPGGRY